MKTWFLQPRQLLRFYLNLLLCHGRGLSGGLPTCRRCRRHCRRADGQLLADKRKVNEDGKNAKENLDTLFLSSRKWMKNFFLLFIFLGGGDNENKLKLTKAVGFGLYLPLIRTR